ncbi:transposase [Sphingomonas parva]|uniref:transposase n=1 Tax=Sphingomonas parva TaxID=2555898 RepID=UPI0014304D3E|nr:transposase [Sphingomonas parva]
MARRRRHTQAFKLSAVARMQDALDVAGLAAELGIDRGLLYKWNRAFQIGGADALLFPGERVRKGLPARVLDAGDRAIGAGVKDAPAVPAGTPELERKVAQQALELDFFRAALQHFAGHRRTSGGSGGTGSTS